VDLEDKLSGLLVLTGVTQLSRSHGPMVPACRFGQIYMAISVCTLQSSEELGRDYPAAPVAPIGRSGLMGAQVGPVGRSGRTCLGCWIGAWN
jgi:hypothetical protein